MATSTEKHKDINRLDQALQILREDMTDPKSQSKFYDIFLNTNYFVPNLDKQEFDGELELEEGQVLPLIIESEGNDYLMLFDTEERLKNWAGDKVTWVSVPGYVLAATTMPPLHWALNIGTEFSKRFVPDEIAWLRDVVERCDQAAPVQEQQN